MFTLFLRVSTRELISSPFRSILVVSGIATGVAMMIAIVIINRGILVHFERSVLALSGRADLQVITPGGEYWLDVALASRIAEVPGVSAAVPIIDTSLPLTDSPERLRVFGVDFTDPRVRSAYGIVLRGTHDILDLVMREDAVLALPSASDGTPQPLETTFHVHTSAGARILRLAAHLDPDATLAAVPETFVVADILRAQQLLGIGDVADRIDIMLAPTQDAATAARQVRTLLGSSFEVIAPAGRSAYFEKTVFAYQRTIEGFSLLALLAAVFIVYSAVSTAVTARTERLATLRSVGARRRDVLGMLALEALSSGLFASVLGTLLGVLLSHRLFGLVAKMMGTIFLVDVESGDLHVEADQVIAAMLMGTLATLLASLYPGIVAVRQDPLEVLEIAGAKPRESTETHTEFFLAASAAMAVMVIGATTIETNTGSILAGNIASVTWFIAFVLFSVPAIAWLSARLAGGLERVFGIVGKIAAANLRRSAGRTSVAVSALAMSVATTITLGGILFSFQESLSTYIEQFMASDLIVASAHNRGGWLEEPMAREIAGRVAEVPGVRSIDTIRFEPGQRFKDERIAIMALSGDFLSPARYARWFVHGDPEAALTKVRNDEGVLVSEALARLTGIGVGDTIRLDAPTGAQGFPVVGVVVDYASDKGTVVISSGKFASVWRDDRINRIHVHLEDGIDVATVRAHIESAVGDRANTKVVDLQRLVSYHRRFLDGAFGAARVLEILIVIVTLTGIFEALLSRVYDRRREFTLMRVTGATGTQVAGMILIEAGMMIVCGMALGVLGGTVSAWMWVKYHFTYLLGWILDFHFPWHIAIRAMTLAGVVAVFAAYGPARAASRGNLLEIVRYE